MAAIPAPPGPNLVLRAGVALAERVVRRRLEPARLLVWYPRAALGFGLMESLVAHRDGRLDARLLQVVRLVASLAVDCPFCIDLNGMGKERNRLTDEEVRALARQAGGEDPAWPESVTELERLAARYAAALSMTPALPGDVLDEVTAVFTPREVVVLATTTAQVNAWARLIRGLGVAAAGFSDTCEIAGRR
ncbi:MAG: carboxymuconolactone decarboxylase family protein [Actinobacteria bacterium]|nr:carboxymuconolactone decarboxylase family protein [Actinomycetota bacterium]